uniref:Uncharacterized protein n=1 Tax=Rhizophagus irregularis (strain DAOM 181602 / DAOM 197198 / MUCL 43194) TaxID=747089 RepID=U9TSN1_RHIID
MEFESSLSHPYLSSKRRILYRGLILKLSLVTVIHMPSLETWIPPSPFIFCRDLTNEQ